MKYFNLVQLLSILKLHSFGFLSAFVEIYNKYIHLYLLQLIITN